MYIPIIWKFSFTLLCATTWFVLCSYLSIPWIQGLAEHIGYFLATFIIFFIALAPGFMSMFLTISYLFDNRKETKVLPKYPPVSVLIAAYNEEANIQSTLKSVLDQHYPGPMQIIVVDDGSTDNTIKVIENLNIDQVLLVKNKHGGKAHALNTALKHAKFEHLITIDADTYLWHDAIKKIVEQYASNPRNTAAVAGSIFVRNSRENVMTRLQEWDFFLAITAIKRMQSLFQGTFVAQGAFSLYIKKYVLEIGGWEENSVCEDIIISWAILAKNYRIDFSEEAAAFTLVPNTYKGFFHQRKRWARGLIEAFKYHPKSLINPRLTILLVYWNLLFPLIDLVFMFVYIPGLILALFGYFYIAGPMTVAVLPLVAAYNIIFFVTQRDVFSHEHLQVRRNPFTLILYVIIYQTIMVPACIAGYFLEIFSSDKKWGGQK